MPTTTCSDETLNTADPPVLVAILIAARRTGDGLLETVARRELECRHSITIHFGQKPGAAESAEHCGGRRRG
jgi:hypothetical protein